MKTKKGMAKKKASVDRQHPAIRKAYSSDGASSSEKNEFLFSSALKKSSAVLRLIFSDAPVISTYMQVWRADFVEILSAHHFSLPFRFFFWVNGTYKDDSLLWLEHPASGGEVADRPIVIVSGNLLYFYPTSQSDPICASLLFGDEMADHVKAEFASIAESQKLLINGLPADLQSAVYDELGRTPPLQRNQAPSSASKLRRFGHMPDFSKPSGWDGKAFRTSFPTPNLPFLKLKPARIQTEAVSNRLVWGDNLSVMRAFEDETFDLIYIDPPFFSGKNYNLIFGDDNEKRTFSDVWEEGLTGYLSWLNARLWEMKRILKCTGSIVVHLDHHAVHYVKVELDNIFGPGNFRNEIIWHYTGGGRSKRYFSRKHDSLLWYSKSDEFVFNVDKVRVPYKPTSSFAKSGIVSASGKRYMPHPDGTPLDSVWDIPIINPMSSERIGYPTQKPEKLLSRLIEALSGPNDCVGDFFCGGGTTPSVAQKLGRQWVACDVSNIAVSVTAKRLRADGGGAEDNFFVEQYGYYDREAVRDLPEEQYREFILQCFQATPFEAKVCVHGLKDGKGIYISPGKQPLSTQMIDEFLDALDAENLTSGVALAWGWRPEIEKRLEKLRSSGGPSVQLVKITLVDIDSKQFFNSNVVFVSKPIADFSIVSVSDRQFVFDGNSSQGRNGCPIFLHEWTISKDSDPADVSVYRCERFKHDFSAPGLYSVSLSVVDRAGVEATMTQKVRVK